MEVHDGLDPVPVEVGISEAVAEAYGVEDAGSVAMMAIVADDSGQPWNKRERRKIRI